MTALITVDISPKGMSGHLVKSGSALTIFGFFALDFFCAWFLVEVVAGAVNKELHSVRKKR